MKILLTSDLHRGFSLSTHIYHRQAAEKLEGLDFDVLVAAGDLASHKPRQLQSCLEFLTGIAKHRPVVACLGNHDWWDVDERVKNARTMRHLHRLYMEEFNVHYVANGPLMVEDVMIVGWDGWWQHEAPDSWRMPPGCPEEAAALVPTQFDAMLQAVDANPLAARRVVAVTHFPVTPVPGGRHSPDYGGDPRLFDHLKGRAHVLLYGHTHHPHDDLIDDIRCVNAGCDYDKPTFKLVEV